MHSQAKRSRLSEPSQVEPSPVVHLRNLPPHTLEIDLLNLLTPHGKIREVALLPQRRQALIEFEFLADAEKFVNICSANPFIIGRDVVPVSFSVSKRILQRAADKNTPTDDMSSSMENHVLLFTVFSALHPITIDLIRTITAPFARIVRIVMFGKAKTQQAMVEFRTIEEARLVKRNLNGADIYSGCCTLKIDYARPERLQVTRNDKNTWDFDMEANEMYGAPHPPAHPPMSLLGAYGGQPTPDYYYQQNGNYVPPPYPVDRCLMAAPMESSRSSTPVVMLYELNMEHMNCDRIFNLLCTYGNVIRVKFLKSKEGVAMVELGDSHSADRVMDNMSGIRLFGNQLSIRASRQTEVAELGQNFKLPDGSNSFKDYSSSRNNRFTTPKFAARNRAFKPSKTLHFWNCPIPFTLDDMNAVCTELQAPLATKLLTYARSSGRTSSGLVQWENEQKALESLAIVNHHEIPNPESAQPFILKLSFAVETIRD